MEQEHIKKALGSVIKSKRKRINLSQTKLAESIGVTKSTVSRYESGEIDIPVSSLVNISEACSFPVKDYIIHTEANVIADTVIGQNAHKIKEEFLEYLTAQENQVIRESLYKSSIQLDIIIRDGDIEQGKQMKQQIIEYSMNHMSDERLAARIQKYIEMLSNK